MFGRSTQHLKIKSKLIHQKSSVKEIENIVLDCEPVQWTAGASITHPKLFTNNNNDNNIQL